MTDEYKVHPLRVVTVTDFPPELTTPLSILIRNGKCFARSGGLLSGVSLRDSENIRILT